MGKNRLEAFSDGVLAIIITVMLLELKVPHGTQLADLLPLYPVFLSYVLSFTYVGVYWNNHHHLLHAAKDIEGGVLWRNHFLLFWLSLVPFASGWMGENHFAPVPTAVYGVVLLMSAVAYHQLVRSLEKHHGPQSLLTRALGPDRKGQASIALYALGIALSLWNAWVGFAVYIGIALWWFVPDKRVEKAMH